MVKMRGLLDLSSFMALITRKCLDLYSTCKALSTKSQLDSEYQKVLFLFWQLTATYTICIR